MDLPDARATESLGRELAALLPADTRGWSVLLKGDLGSGKSTVARAMLREFGHNGPVPSPTYTLVEPYEIADRLVYHVDLYRLSGEGDLPYLGWTDMEDGLMLIEWPERAPLLENQADICLRLAFCGAGREALLVGLSGRGIRVLSGRYCS